MLDSLITSMSPSRKIDGGKEDGVASVQYYFNQMFSGAYHIYYDLVDSLSPKKREHPCIIIDQIDFYSDGTSFFGDRVGGGAKGRRERLQMYFRCVADITEAGGTKRLARRMRDQVYYVLTHAGVVDETKSPRKFFCPPIILLEFSDDPSVAPVMTETAIQVARQDGAIQDRFVANYQTPHLVQYDVLARFEYITREKPVV